MKLRPETELSGFSCSQGWNRPIHSNRVAIGVSLNARALEEWCNHEDKWPITSGYPCQTFLCSSIAGQIGQWSPFKTLANASTPPLIRAASHVLSATYMIGRSSLFRLSSPVRFVCEATRFYNEVWRSVLGVRPATAGFYDSIVAQSQANPATYRFGLGHSSTKSRWPSL